MDLSVLTKALPSRDAVQKELAQKSLRHFTKQAWSQAFAVPYIPGWHIDAISDHLDAVRLGQIKKLIINIPPRHSKSSQVGVFWPAQVWTTMPGCQFIYGSHDQQLATRDNLQTRRLIDTKWYKDRWGKTVALQPDNSLKQYFELTSNGSRRAVSVGAGITGSGADILVCDDPHNVLQALQSDVLRHEAIEWWQTTMSSRLNPGSSLQARVIIMQRVHEKDLTGYLLDHDPSYELLCLPAEYETHHPFVSHTSLNFVDPREKAGEILWQEGMPPERVRDLAKDLGSYSASGQLQQRPSPEGGGLVRGSWFRMLDRAEWPKKFEEIAIFVDLSVNGQENADETAIAILGRIGVYVYFIGLIHRPMGFKEQITILELVHKLYPTAGIHVEQAGNAQAVFETLKEHIPGIILIPATKSKLDRVLAWSIYAESGNCFLPAFEPWVSFFIHQAELFPNGKHDDCIDAFGMGVLHLIHRGTTLIGADQTMAVETISNWKV